MSAGITVIGRSLLMEQVRNRRKCRVDSDRVPNGIRRLGSVAEEVGFEPTVRFHARRFSRPVHSTTLPLLRSGLVIGSNTILKVAKEGSVKGLSAPSC